MKKDDVVVPVRCSLCKQTKPDSEFYQNRATTNGLTCWCKVCTSEYHKETRRILREAKKGYEI